LTNEYQKNMGREEFLNFIYIKLVQKFNIILDLMKKNKISTEELKILYKTKDKILKVFEILIINSNDKEFQNLLKELSILTISKDIKNIKYVAEFCKNVRN